MLELSALFHRCPFIHLQETQTDSDKLKRDSLVNAIAIAKAQEKDLLDYVQKNEALDPKKAVKLKDDAKVSIIDSPQSYLFKTWFQFSGVA